MHDRVSSLFCNTHLKIVRQGWKVSFFSGFKDSKKYFYVNDLLSGSNSIVEVKQFVSDLIALFENAGYNLRIWASNSPDLPLAIFLIRFLLIELFQLKITSLKRF